MVLHLEGTIILYLLFILCQDEQTELPDPRHPQRANRPVCWVLLWAPPWISISVSSEKLKQPLKGKRTHSL